MSSAVWSVTAQAPLVTSSAVSEFVLNECVRERSREYTLAVCVHSVSCDRSEVESYVLVYRGKP